VHNFLNSFKSYKQNEYHIKTLKDKYNGVIPKKIQEKNFQTSTPSAFSPYEK